jgi:hypothetical protein
MFFSGSFSVWISAVARQPASIPPAPFPSKQGKLNDFQLLGSFVKRAECNISNRAEETLTLTGPVSKNFLTLTD